MSYEDLIYSVEDGIATITLNRPTRLNALSPNLEEELHRAFDEGSVAVTGSSRKYDLTQRSSGPPINTTSQPRFCRCWATST